MDILSNAGVNMTLNTGSGTPFSYRNVANNSLVGRINGSIMPWRTTMNLRIDKDIYWNLKGGEGDSKKTVIFNVYADIQNVLNVANIVGVYSTTGNPDDNGYLTYSGNQSEIASNPDEEAYRNFYTLYMDNPYNYNMPRRFNVGVVVSF